MQGARIMVVEDDFLIRLTLVEALSDEGFDVTEAGSGDEALTLLRADASIQLLMTDIQLPGTIDGRQLAQAIRTERPELPMIFMTGQPRPNEVSSARDVYISKPYLPSEVCAAARRIIG